MMFEQGISSVNVSLFNHRCGALRSITSQESVIFTVEGLIQFGGSCESSLLTVKTCPPAQPGCV